MVGVARAPAALAAQRRKMQALREAREAKREAAAASAHEDGALACLKFAREEGIDWDEHVVGWAAEVGNHQILRYALRRKAPQPEFWVRPEGFEV